MSFITNHSTKKDEYGRPKHRYLTHMSSYYAEYEEDMANQFMNNFARFKENEPLENVVDKSLGFVPSDS